MPCPRTRTVKAVKEPPETPEAAMTQHIVKTPFQLRTRHFRDAVVYGVSILLLGVGAAVVWWLLS
jgi:hypothetical protein